MPSVRKKIKKSRKTKEKDRDEENTKYEHCLLGEQTNVSCSQKNKIKTRKTRKTICGEDECRVTHPLNRALDI